MPCEVTWELRGAYKKFVGHITDHDLVHSVTSVHENPRFDELRYVINDFLDIEGFDVAEDTVKYIAAIDKAAAHTNPHIKIAIVLTDVQAAMLAQHYTNSPWTVYPTRIFPSVEQARTWV
jgi:hypothetical protein